MRGGGRGTYERRRKRDFQEEEEEGLSRGGGRGIFERRRKRDFQKSLFLLLFLFILNYILWLSLDVPLHVGQNEEEQPIRGRECRSK